MSGAGRRTGISPMIDRPPSEYRSARGRQLRPRSHLRWSVLIIALVSMPAGAVDDEPVTPLRPTPVESQKAKLGERLFRDAWLSRGATVACTSCHRLDRAGNDGRSQPLGADGQPLDFNSPTIFNAALNYRLNWRGNFRTLEEQNEAVLLDRRLMNTTWEELLAKLRAHRDYAA